MNGIAGEVLAQSLPHLERNLHPIIIIRAYKLALETALSIIDDICIPVNIQSDEEMLKLIQTSIGTKFVNRWSDLMCNLALKAVRIVAKDVDISGTGPTVGKKEVDIKRYARIEKVSGGLIEDSTVLQGVMVNKDVTHPKMRRFIVNPRIILLDCPLEYKKGESQTDIEIKKEEDWNRVLEIEEEQIKGLCDKLNEFKPDIVFTEKGVSGEHFRVRMTDFIMADMLSGLPCSDLAQHYLLKANVSAIRRVRKSDNNRIARAIGATIVNRIEDLRESDVGTGCGEFRIDKLGDE